MNTDVSRPRYLNHEAQAYVIYVQAAKRTGDPRYAQLASTRWSRLNEVEQNWAQRELELLGAVKEPKHV